MQVLSGLRVLSGMRAGLLAIAALVGAVSGADADSATIRIRIFKAGFIVGGSAGEVFFVHRKELR